MKPVVRERTAHLSARPGAVVLLLAIAAAAFACRDITAPVEQSPSSGSQRLLNAPGRVVVSPDSMHGWAFYDDQHDAACTDATVCHMTNGPTGQPSGFGSAELATASLAQGKALILADYAGTRLDKITALQYSTFRQTADQGNNLAIALQFNVDYDLSDQSTNYQGRLVYEPYQAAPGGVAQGTWQTWDAKAGKWWGTKGVVKVGDVNTANPCVQSSPCSWSQLLATFPNLGIHAVYGAVVLKAGSGWANFRGNVDALTIGVDNVGTTYDFEVGPRLTASIGSGVIGPHIASDSSYTVGATISYNFAAAAGHEGPHVIIDSQFVAAQGTIIMDRPHHIEAVADTIYTMQGLTTVEQELATRTTALLTSDDKVSALMALTQFELDRSASGVSDEQLAHELDVVSYLVIDPVRDGVALEAVDARLAGEEFMFITDPAGRITITPYENPSSVYTRTGASPTLERDRASAGQRAVSPSRAGLHATTAPVSRLLRGAPPTQLAPPAGASRATLASTSDSHEEVWILYVNGIYTAGDPVDPSANGAAFTLSHVLEPIMKTLPEFAAANVHFDWVYNPSVTTELKAWDQAHPCALKAIRGYRLFTRLKNLWDFAHCAGEELSIIINDEDLSRAAMQRLQLTFGQQPTLPIVRKVADRMLTHRYWNRDLLLVGHSQGNLVIAQALATLREVGHPPLQSNRCIAMLALASPATRGSIPLDANHLSGFTVDGDIIRATFPGNWDILQTPSSDAANAIVSATEPNLAAGARARQSYLLHLVNTSYLTDPVAQGEVKSRLTTLLHECVPQRLEVSPSVATVVAGDTLKVSAKLFNFNGRWMPERKARVYSIDGTIEDFGVDSMFYVYAPFESIGPLHAYYEQDYTDSVVVRSSPVIFNPPTLADASFSSWERIEGTNGGSSVVVEPPDGAWPQSLGESSCGQTVRRDGPDGWAGANYMIFRLNCFRRYVLVKMDSISDPLFGRSARYSVQLTGVDGVVGRSSETSFTCPTPAQCFQSFSGVATVNDRRVGYTSEQPMPPYGGGSASRVPVAPPVFMGRRSESPALSRPTGPQPR